MKKMIFMIVFLLLGSVCFGHDVEYSVIKGGVGIKVYYSDGTPMSDSEVKIFSPENAEIEFQTGMTDKNGCFIFCPNSKGKWKIKVNDGMGHMVIKEIEVSEDLIPQIETTYHLPLWKKILWGVSVIFGLSGILFYIIAKKKFEKVSNIIM